MNAYRDPGRPARIPVPACDLLRGLREAIGYTTCEEFANERGVPLSTCVWLEAQTKPLCDLRAELGAGERDAIGRYGMLGIYLAPLELRVRVAQAVLANAS